MNCPFFAKPLWRVAFLSLSLCEGLASYLNAQGIELSEVERVAFIGNSITLHGPKADIDWNGNWGMAATEAQRDYVHRIAKRLEDAMKHTI
jgi:hypothetical protein